MLKSLSLIAMLLGLGFFTVGCEKPADPGADPAAGVTEEDPAADPAGMEDGTDAPVTEDPVAEEPAADPAAEPEAAN